MSERMKHAERLEQYAKCSRIYVSADERSVFLAAAAALEKLARIERALLDVEDQDDHVYTPSERALDVRLDCMAERREAAARSEETGERASEEENDLGILGELADDLHAQLRWTAEEALRRVLSSARRTAAVEAERETLRFKLTFRLTDPAWWLEQGATPVAARWIARAIEDEIADVQTARAALAADPEEEPRG